MWRAIHACTARMTPPQASTHSMRTRSWASYAAPAMSPGRARSSRPAAICAKFAPSPNSGYSRPASSALVVALASIQKFRLSITSPHISDMQ